MINVLMAGVDRSTRGGMWSVVENYVRDAELARTVKLRYIATASTGSRVRKAACFVCGLVRIMWNLIANRPDVVHLHMSERGSVRRKNLIGCLAKQFGSKVIIHMHGAEFQSWYETLDTHEQQCVKRCLNRADCILILGEYWRGFLGGLMEDKAKIKVLYNAVNVPEANPYNHEACHLLFLGEVGERKGVYDLLTAVKCVDEQLPAETKLLLYGPNPDGDIQQRILKQGLEARVQYCGWADQKTKEEVFARTAINILPSHHEGLPMTLLEAMAHGIPCIATDVAAIPEVVKEDNGLLISPGDTSALADAVLMLVRDAAARQMESVHAYQTVKDLFSMEVHRSRLLQIYTEMTEKQT